MTTGDDGVKEKPAAPSSGVDEANRLASPLPVLSEGPKPDGQPLSTMVRPRSAPPATLDPLLIQQLIQYQGEELRFKGEELKVRHEELRLRNAEMEGGLQYSLRSLAVQENDQKDQRKHVLEVSRLRYISILAGGLVAAGVIVYALGSGNREFAEKALQQVVIFFGGTGVGYGFGRKARGRQQPIEGDGDPPPSSK